MPVGRHVPPVRGTMGGQPQPDGRYGGDGDDRAGTGPPTLVSLGGSVSVRPSPSDVCRLPATVVQADSDVAGGAVGGSVSSTIRSISAEGACCSVTIWGQRRHMAGPSW